jgi:DNA sulfur modification protein DndD
MKISEIEIENFRIYKGVNKISFDWNSDNNITIISGRNGFGKTTFLMSLVWCLYGKQMQDVDELYKKEISDQGGYSKYINGSLNRLARTNKEYNMSVTITFSDINIPEVPCKEIKVKRVYNAKSSTSDEVEVFIDGHPNEIAKDVGHEEFIREFIMPIEIAKFFFFDAEKIVNLANVKTQEQSYSLSKAYSEVLGIKKYEDIKEELEQLQLKLRRETANAEEESRFRTLEVEIVNCEEKIVEKQNTIDEYRELLSEKKSEARAIQEKLIRIGSHITNEMYTELVAQESILSNKLNDIHSEMSKSLEIIPFAIVAENLVEMNNQLNVEIGHKRELVQNHHTETIINDIVNELSKDRPGELVIDYRVQRFYEDRVSILLKKHLLKTNEIVNEEVVILHDFSDIQAREVSELVNYLRNAFSQSFKRIMSEYNFTKNELHNVRKRLRDAELEKDDVLTQKYRFDKDQLESEVIRYENSIDQLNREIGELSNQKTQKVKEIGELAKKLHVSKNNKEKNAVISRNIQNLKDFIVRFKELKKTSLEQQILKVLQKLLHKEHFVKGVEVEIVHNTIEINLIDSRGDVIPKESLSKGEQQMYATALLTGLVEESDIDFPIFIDSPMQKYDEQHARNIVQYFYPEVSEQVIIFPLINKELNSIEYEILKNKISKTYLIDNLNTDHSVFIEIAPDQFINTYNQKYNNAN